MQAIVEVVSVDKREYLDKLVKAKETILKNIKIPARGSVTFRMNLNDEIFEAFILATTLIEIRIKELRDELENDDCGQNQGNKFPNGIIQTVPELRAEAKRMGYKIIKVNPPRTAKYIKCKDCKYLCGKKTNIGIECLHPTRKFRTQLAHYKPPANKACLKFERKDNDNE